MQDLDDDRAVQAGIAGFVDLTHAAGPDGGDDLRRSELPSGLKRHRSIGGLHGLRFQDA